MQPASIGTGTGQPSIGQLMRLAAPALLALSTLAGGTGVSAQAPADASLQRSVRTLSAEQVNPLLDTLSRLNVGTLFLELCTPRAGEIEILKALPDRLRIGVGVCNQKHSDIEAVDEIMRKGEQAIQIFGKERVLLNPDCGFATFADNPVSSDRVAEGKLKTLALASARLRERHGV